MLVRLSIRDVVLIDRLDLDFKPGLGVLTGETGAGKSILLDSLGLALGVRAEARLVRHGQEQAGVTAEFSLPADHGIFALLREHAIDCAPGEPVILKRVLTADGRSRAFICDQSVSVSLLRQVGDALVEIHGQFDNHRMLNPALHGGFLDAHGGHGSLLAAVKAAHKAWRDAVHARERFEAELAQAREDEDFLRHAVNELTALAPQPGEEQTLDEQRRLMMGGEKLLDAMNKASDVLDDGHGVERMLRDALRTLEPVRTQGEGILDPVMEALDQAQERVAEAVTELNSAASRLDLDPQHLEQVEDRLFELRAQARKHNVAVDDLAALADRLSAQLGGIDDGEVRLKALRDAEDQTRQAYLDQAKALSAKRQAAGAKLDQAVQGELAPLKLGQAQFVTDVRPQDDEAAWGEAGLDKIQFLVATNPGAPAGPLGKIASGGELARFTLALKVVLTESDPVPTLIFDEVDTGIGGAVADAVGQRLARLGDAAQVLVVTHAPQVAAKGAHHYHVSKSEADGRTATTVKELADAVRTDEIARMLSGDQITPEARAQATRLLEGAGA